ncbi:unnamed protein product [Mucor hiemalis]
MNDDKQEEQFGNGARNCKAREYVQRVNSKPTALLSKSVMLLAQELGKTATPGFTASLAEILYSQMITMANNLESFASHGKRSVISMEDVKLCARRNDSLHELITASAKEITEDMNSKKKKK